MRTPRLLLGVLVAMLAAPAGGCKKTQADRQETPAEVVALPAARPEALVQAEDEIRGGKVPAAEARLREWIAANPVSPYSLQAQYMLGQARFAQGDYEGAKKLQEEVAEKAADRTLKALALFARADCNFQLNERRLASRQYHWIEQFYRDVTAIPQDELLFKLGLCAKLVGFQETADYWFEKLIELYPTTRFAAEARMEHGKLGPGKTGEPTYYSLEVGTFSDEQKALSEAQVYREKGYAEVAVREVSLFGTPYYCVNIGRFFNRNEALRAKEDAKLAGISAAIRPGWITLPLK